MSTLSADLEQAVRAIVRDEIAKASGKPATPPTGGSGITPYANACGIKSKAGICRKAPGHDGRHKYEAPSANPTPHTPVTRNWKKVKDVYVQRPNYLKRTHYVVGNPCRVQGERGMWVIVGMEQHTEDASRINVEVKNDRSGHSRTFPVDRIIPKQKRTVKS